MKLTPALRQVVSVLCLVLFGAQGITFAAPPVRKHRARVVVSTDPAKGDLADNDDPIVRQAAVEALGHESGSVLAVDPTTGRILTIVNQKMAFSAGFEPCSTIKPFIAVAGLEE